MIIEYSPIAVFANKKIEYTFYNETILATVNNDELLFDFSNIAVGKQYELQFPIRDIKRNEDGILEVSLTKYHAANAMGEERFPEQFEAVNEELKTDAEPIQLEELIVEELEHQPSTVDVFMLAIADLDAQREQDKLEQQIAMAELAETLIGGSF